MKSTKVAVLAGIALLAFAIEPLLAKSAIAQEPEIQITVTVVHRSSAAPPRLTADDILVYQRHERRPVVSWAPAEAPGRRTDLAVLVDDSAGNSFGNQISDLKSFINSLPDSVQVAVAYARQGDASILQNFTNNHAAASKALRLPVGRANEGSSIYMAVTDMVKRFPNDGNLHEVFLISDGIDLYRGVMDSEPGLNPDLTTAIHHAVRAHVTVFTIFTNTAGFARRNLFLVNNGQSCLSRFSRSARGANLSSRDFRRPCPFSLT